MKKTVSRPYLTYSIARLEELFDQWPSDRDVLHALSDELRFRKTGRAHRLDVKIRNVLATPPGTNEAPNRSSTREPKKVRPVRGIPGDEPSPFPISPTEDEGSAARVSQGANEPGAILRAWTALEALSPQTYRRPEDLSQEGRGSIADFSCNPLPWERDERSRPGKQLYYQVVLGAVLMERATAALLKAFGEDEEINPRIREKAPMAAILVDRKGVLVAEKGIAVSSFVWALPRALRLEFGSLAGWPTVETKLVEKLELVLRTVDEHGNALPLDIAAIYRAHSWLLTQCGMAREFVEEPTFAIRVFHYFKARNPPEVSLLNSFFLSDLQRAARLERAKDVPAGLGQYLGARKQQPINLLADKTFLEAAIAPVMTPAARWPSRGGHPLVLLQQAAVNLACSEQAGLDGMIAINGPPGTGKTTLLRDVVAQCVLVRALEMAKFEDPERAFTPSGQTMPAGENAFFQIYSVASELKGHEVLVASSNNKAVENISRELPTALAVGRTTEELRYFKSVSDLLYRQSTREDSEQQTESVASEPPIETWGLIAAVLGNARNREKFSRCWWDPDYGLRLYLKAAKGDSVVREVTDPATGKIERVTPAIIFAERPPTPDAAKVNWQKARRDLVSLHAEVTAELAAVERVRELSLKLSETRRVCATQADKIAGLIGRQAEVDGLRLQSEADLARAIEDQHRTSEQVELHFKCRPGFFARLFRTEKWKEWANAHSPLATHNAAALRLRDDAERRLLDLSANLNAIKSEARTFESRLREARAKAAQLSTDLEGERRRFGDRLVDDQFFERKHDVWNLSSPWISDALHKRREDLFVEAIATHKAFIDASAPKLLHNLSNLMTVLSQGVPKDKTKQAFLGDLWSSLFLVVPVISTTFASVERMFGNLAPGSIGWLLIDEAGQALPQAAIGAVTRSRRSIVVGDPMQIPPVVTLPQQLSYKICEFFKVEKLNWASPDASAQTLADRASRIQATFRTDTGTRRVGIPLLVHRRCQEPMFGISNRIAYSGQMVYATGTSQVRKIEKAIGPSTWISIDEEADSKWCPAEGEAVVALLHKLALAGLKNPDLFIITPFRIVAQELKRRLTAEGQLFADLGVDSAHWIRDRVGTIHTVQGREAEAVILVLGAPKASQHGARTWAAGTPHILNVAVSRAKHNLYVIGSYGAWASIGHCHELRTLCHDPIQGCFRVNGTEG